jgi:hypothetical protein
MQYTTWSLVIDSLLAESGEFRDVYVSFRGDPFAADEPIIVTSEDEWEAGDSDVPSVARGEGMTHCLDDAQIEDVVDNLLMRDSRASVPQIVEALRYFVKNDAFMEI